MGTRAAAGTKAPVTHRVQGTSSVTKTVDFKYAQYESSKLTFLWGDMRTAAWETEPPVALRNCSTEVGRKDWIYMISVKWEYMQSTTFF